jgi:signal transduction histidine kinase
VLGPEPPGGRLHDGGWWLVVRHRDGSLQAAVGSLRRRNLAISLLILGLLAATSALMIVAAQRVQRLARQQLEFVAGVSHELRTPLTAMRSAGQNLAAGVVAEPAQVRRYGDLIEREGRRLSDMVGKILEFAGIQSDRQGYDLKPQELSTVLDGALEDCRPLLEERGARVERLVDPGLPRVVADAGALRRALRNLVENAAKYGGREPWIGVRATLAAAGREVEVTVTDRGPGIRREDLRHLFEPFYRGRGAAVAGIPGSGLGLSVVRHVAAAHRGRVSVEGNAPGGGSIFTLHLPAALAEAGA